MNAKSKKPSGMLMVIMDSPAAGDEQEFHDWYDLEHVPERERISGFRTVQRFVCLEGWPQYMAFYDLDHVGILTEPSYAAISGPNFSPWSKRVIAGVRGWTRVEAEQALSGNACTGEKGVPLRLAVLRLRGVSADHDQKAGSAIGTLCEGTECVLQSRLFRATTEAPADIYAIVEFSAPVQLSSLNWSALKLPSGYVDIANMYSRYWRRD